MNSIVLQLTGVESYVGLSERGPNPQSPTQELRTLPIATPTFSDYKQGRTEKKQGVTSRMIAAGN